MIAFSFQSFATHPWFSILGASLLHFIWQAALISLMLAAALSLFRRGSAQVRYWIACAGLLLMASSPILTAAWFYPSTVVVRQTATPSSETRDLHQGETIFIPLVTDDVPAARVVPEYAQEQDSSEESTDEVALVSSAASNAKSTNDVQRLIEIVQPWCVLCWFIGVGILTLRLTAGVIRVRKWRKSAIHASPRDVQTMFAALLRRMNIRLPVKLLESSHVAVPMVIGWIKPAVLLPPSLISNLSTDELESILAHELAHIRRLDPFVNVMQLIVETLLFYHPAVWWVSRQIRVERENCCDDVAVSVCGSPMLFARALTRLEEARISETRLVLSANHGSLLRRIQRLVAKEPTSATAAWPVSLIATGFLVLLVAGFWMSTATAADQTELKQDESQQEASDNFDDDQDEKPKTVVHETIKQDSKTGIKQALFPGIRLSFDADGVEHQAKLDMKYSNVIRYSFIPASIAAALNAVEYGTIDFGDQPPNAKGGFPGQTLDLDWDALRELDAAGDLSDSGTVQLGIPEQPPQQLQDLAKKRRHINELKQPLADDQTIVPYADDPLWAPGHLGFYGMNQTEQTKFRVVRIDQVSLGIGPAIGPVFALVNDDDNSDFGLLGSDWARQVRGDHGEGLWFSADGTMRFMPPPKQIAPRLPIDPNSDGTILSTPSNTPDSFPQDDAGWKILKTHRYSLARRESTGWVKVDGANVPVDVGLQHGDTIVYLTLMFDVIAIDSETRDVRWALDWRKTDPIWETLTILERPTENGEKQIEVSISGKKGTKTVVKHLSLVTGEVTLEWGEGAARDALPLNVIEEDNDKIKRAELKAIPQGRSAVDVAEALKMMSRLSDGLGDSITMNETLVSAENATYLPHTLEAQEIIFNLPEGSGMRAEFSGEKIDFRDRDDGSTWIVVNHGKIELIDSVGVIRAWASPDGGAEQLVIECRFANKEYSLKMRSQRLQPSDGETYPPVQCVVFPESGAPEKEEQPPHGAVRFQVRNDQDAKTTRFKMMWRYDVDRVLREAAKALGVDVDEYLDEFKNETPQPQIDIAPGDGN